MDDIVRELVAEFEVTDEQARKDVAAFLDDLRERNMLATSGNGGSPGASE